LGANSPWKITEKAAQRFHLDAKMETPESQTIAQGILDHVARNPADDTDDEPL
jgi:hypothetical protein